MKHFLPWLLFGVLAIFLARISSASGWYLFFSIICLLIMSGISHSVGQDQANRKSMPKLKLGQSGPVVALLEIPNKTGTAKDKTMTRVSLIVRINESFAIADWSAVAAADLALIKIGSQVAYLTNGIKLIQS
ncbi:MAG: hypothetical protein C3F02_04140 [Parcubacteria group bacterium]|nr:MAG: hypothetical protein C3F02_04140 [Parcubacteria group bacterium]